MVNPRNKSETLSETTKTFLREVWIKEVFGREKYVSTQAMEKGTMVESDSLALVQEVLGETHFKNNRQIENEFVIGTPDVLDDLIDIKSSWDLWTFAEVDGDKAFKDYYHQVLGYAWILGKTSARICYCLVNTPEDIIQHELYRLTWKMSEQEAIERYRKNYEFDDIPAKNRVKCFRFAIDPDDIEKLKERVVAARKYLSEMSL